MELLFLCMYPFDRLDARLGLIPLRMFALLVLLALFQVPPVPAQFTYLGSDFGYSSIELKGDGRNFIQTLPLRLSVVHRPWRNVGMGATYAIPLSQKVDFTPSGASSGYNSWGPYGRFTPTIVNDISAKDEFSGFLRFYFETEYNFFIDCRLRSYMIEQFFSLYRGYSPPEYWSAGDLRYAEVPERSASFATGKRSISPGLGVGMAPHIGKHGFLSVQFEIDFVELKSHPFSMPIESNSRSGETWYEYRTIRSELHGLTIAWMITAGGGVYF